MAKKPFKPFNQDEPESEIEEVEEVEVVSDEQEAAKFKAQKESAAKQAAIDDASGTIEGGAYMLSDHATWVNSEGEPLKAEQVAAAKSLAADKAKARDEQMKAIKAEPKV